MSSKKNNFKNKFIENKTRRVVNSEKKYNKSERSKSNQNYIDGNYTKSINQKVFGIRNELAKGNTVSGYGSDYVDTKGMKRSRYLAKQEGKDPYEPTYLYVGGKPKTVETKDGNSFKTQTRYLTKEEKDSYKNTGELYHKNYRKSKSYLDTKRDEGGNFFDDRLKFWDNKKGGIKWDGLETAKYNQKDGKHLQNIGHYAIGLGKDLVADPLVDFLKGVDRYESAITNGAYALVENYGNVLGGGQWDKDLVSDVVKHSLKESDETGWGTSSADNWRNIAKRDGTKLSKGEDIALGVLGFGADIFNPINLGGKVSDVVKGSLKGAKNALKGVDSATDVMSSTSGFVPKSLRDLRGKNIKPSNTANGLSDDVFYSGSKGDTGLDRQLDNQYMKRMELLKDDIKQNPKTSNLGKYLDVLDDKKSYSGVQRNIDGRVLNKKHTQSSDGYIPQQINRNEVEELRDNKISGQYSMFSKDGTMDAYIENVQNPNARYERVFNKYSNDIDGLVEKIDSMKPENQDLMYDYLLKNQPEVYEQIVKGSDEIDEIIEGSVRRTEYKDEYTSQSDKKYHNTPNLRSFSDIDNVDDVSKLNENYNKFNFERMLKDTNSEQIIEPRLSVKESKSIFNTGLNKYLDKIYNMDYNELGEMSKTLDSIIDAKKGTPIYKKTDALNKILFDGKKIIRDNIPTRTLDGFVKYLKDNINLNISERLGEDTFTRLNGNTFDLRNPDGSLKNLRNESSMFAPSAVDVLFEDKMSDIATQLKVPNKKFLENQRDELKALKRERVLTTDEFYRLKDIENQINTWNKLYQDVANMDDEYLEYAQNVYGKADRNKGYKTVLDELAEQQAKIDSTKGKENIIREAKHKSELGSDPNVTASPRAQGLFHKNVDEYDQVINQKASGNIRNEITPKEKYEYGKNIGLKYVNTKTPIQVSKDKQTFRNIYSYKNAKNAIDNLATLVRNEIGLVKDTSYNKNYATTRMLIEDNIRYLDNLGVDRKVYFNEVKNLKLKLLDSIKKDMQVGSNLRGIKPKSGKLKNTTKNINPLEMTHMRLNGKPLDKLSGLTPEELQMQYLRTQGAKSIDELFDIPDANLLQRGDNIGIKIPNNNNNNNNNNNKESFGQLSLDDILLDNTHTQLNDNSYLPELIRAQGDFPSDDFNVLDYMKPNVDDDSQVNMLGYITGNKLDVDKKPLLKVPKSKRLNIPTVPKNVQDELTFKRFADILYGFGINPYERAPKEKPKDMNGVAYRVWKEFSDNLLSDDVSKRGLSELNKIDDYISKKPKKDIENMKAPKIEIDESLANLNIYEDSMKKSTKIIHDNIDKYNEINKNLGFVDNSNFDSSLSSINDINSGRFNPNQEPTFKEFKENISKNTNDKIPYEDNELYDMYKSWLNTWKKGLTVYNPGWHIQNYFQNKGQNYLALGSNAFAPQTDARQILKNIQGKPNKSVNIFDKINNKNYTNDELAKLAQDLGVVDGVGEDVSNARGIFPRLENKIDNSNFMKKLNESEQTARLHHFLTQINNGMTPEQASNSVNKYLFDYNDKSKADKFISDFIDPFWMFHKNNARLMTTSMLEHPSRINNIIRATNGLGDDDYEGDKIKMPHVSIQDDVNKATYDYLYSENMMPDIKEAVPFDREGFEGKLNPLLRIALQQSRGEGNFGNKITESEEAKWGEITKQDRAKEILKELNPFASPLVKTYLSTKERKERLEDEKQGEKVTNIQILLDWVNYITGNKGNYYRNMEN